MSFISYTLLDEFISSINNTCMFFGLSGGHERIWTTQTIYSHRRWTIIVILHKNDLGHSRYDTYPPQVYVISVVIRVDTHCSIFTRFTPSSDFACGQTKDYA